MEMKTDSARAREREREIHSDTLAAAVDRVTRPAPLDRTYTATAERADGTRTLGADALPCVCEREPAGNWPVSAERRPKVRTLSVEPSVSFVLAASAIGADIRARRGVVSQTPRRTRASVR